MSNNEQLLRYVASVIEEDCHPDTVSLTFASLREAGMPCRDIDDIRAKLEELGPAV